MFTYEDHKDFQGFVTMPVLGNADSFLEDMIVPGMVDFNPMFLLHG
jgi:hypothetical protein